LYLSELVVVVVLVLVLVLLVVLKCVQGEILSCWLDVLDTDFIVETNSAGSLWI
jgi:hypothetical protein